jgi:hypothetical protein
VPRLSRLTVAFLSASYYDEFLNQPLLNLTHLEVVLVLVLAHLFWKEKGNMLTHLPKMTHLNVGTGIKVGEILKLLPLKILVVVPYYHSLLLPPLGHRYVCVKVR